MIVAGFARPFYVQFLATPLLGKLLVACAGRARQGQACCLWEPNAPQENTKPFGKHMG